MDFFETAPYRQHVSSFFPDGNIQDTADVYSWNVIIPAVTLIFVYTLLQCSTYGFSRVQRKRRRRANWPKGSVGGEDKAGAPEIAPPAGAKLGQQPAHDLPTLQRVRSEEFICAYLLTYLLTYLQRVRS